MTEGEKLATALAERDKYVLEVIGGCSDGYCIVVKPKGMHTNGGCRCSSDRVRMQQLAFANNRFLDAVRSTLSRARGEGGENG